MGLTSGTKLGPYEITGALGAGGMGEVYRARDTRLDRAVAIKVLPQQFSSDPLRKQRFEREAKTISGLNHPHICVVYDVGQQDGLEYIVMECLEGESLADRLHKGSLPLEQVLKLGAQIADALDRAHRNGIVHRDLKPGNIMLTVTGAKLLDFGLAKPSAPLATGATLTTSAKESPVTEKGTVVGTFQYMSPEQIEGKDLDGRSDIFSLGAVLYEMLTGQRAFQGKSQLSVASAILEKEPAPINSFKPMTPASLDHAIRRCLVKDREERWQTARDLMLELKWLSEAGIQTGTSEAAKGRTKAREWFPWSTALFLGAAVVASFFLNWRRKPPEEEPVRFQIALPAGTGNFTLSPNGRMLAIIANGPNGRHAIYKRDLDSLDTQMLPGTEGPVGPPVFWSPDSRFVVFQAGSTLKKLDVTGGPPQAICDVPAVVLGGDWNRDGEIIFGTAGHGVMKVSAVGGEPQYVTDTGGVNEVHAFPFFLPDGNHFLYLQTPRNTGIYTGTLDAKLGQQNPKLILATNRMAVYAPSGNTGTGYLLFLRENTLLAQAFDERKLELFGDTYSITSEVGTFLESANITASTNGMLAFRAGKSANPVSGLEWYDRQGRVLGQVEEVGGETPLYIDLVLSPDGKKAATAQFNPRHGPIPGIWLHDLARGASVPLTSDIAPDSSPAWSPDGSRVSYAAIRKGGSGIFAKEADGSGKEVVLVEPTDDPKFPNGWSSDGRHLLYTESNPKTSSDLWALPLAVDGTPSGPPIPIAKTEFAEGQGQFSPDMRWVAYTSNVSGRPEVYVQSFPAPPGGAAKTLVSQGGGTQARWRRDGKELFYLSLDGKAMAVEVSEGPVFKAGVPRSLFQVLTSSLASEDFRASFRWDVTADGKKFLIDTEKPSTDPATVVLNWTKELKEK